jgi:predicted DNA-binding transcriptional regulator AlpA
MPRPDIDLMGAAEIGQRLRLSKQRTYVIIGRKGFPDPQAELAMGKVWLSEDVETWIKTNRPHLDDEPDGA